MRNGNTKELSYNHEAFVESSKTAYYSKVSVCYITAGYIIGVFGDVGDANRWKTLGIIAAITGILVLCTRFMVKNHVKMDSIEWITNDELMSVSAEPDMESISDEEIDGL